MPVQSIAFGVSSLVFKPEGGKGHFADKQLANHYVFVYDDIADRLDIFCRLANIRMIFQQG